MLHSVHMKKNIQILIISLFLVTSALASQPSDTIRSEKFDTELFEKTLLQKVNEYRKSKGKGELKPDPLVYKAAKDHRDFLKSSGKLTHSQPTADKKSVRERVEFYVKVDIFLVGENLAKTFVLIPTYNYDRSGKTNLSTAYTYEEAADYMLNAWIQSTFHNKNMLNDEYTTSGLSVYFNPKDKSLTATHVLTAAS